MPDDRFAADWLTLREPVDHRSRAGHLDAEVAARGAVRGWKRVVDLGSGTGSNLRYLAPRLPWAREWTLVDHDADLLDRVRVPGTPGSGDGGEVLQRPGDEPGTVSVGRSSIEVERVHGDLAEAGLAAAADSDLVTASALLDLVTREWLVRLVETVTTGAGALLIALSYDGEVRWLGQDADSDDAWVAGLVNRHQRGTKEMGRALGPDAPGVARTLLEEAGWRCTLAPSPWVLDGASDLPLARAWLEGWVDAATAVAPGEADRIRAWSERRSADLAAGRVGVQVGHQDLLALPEAPGS